jgi:hypothetical protein
VPVAEIVGLNGKSGIGWLYVVSSVRSYWWFLLGTFVRAFLAWHVAVAQICVHGLVGRDVGHDPKLSQ